jgi:hypothetical protein
MLIPKKTTLGISSLSIAAILVLAPAILTTRAFAQPPSNDDFNDATVISSLPFSDSLNNEEATSAADDPSSACFGETHTVWYSFTPDEDVTINANTIGSEFDASLSVHTGSRGSLNLLGCSSGSLTFEATAGETYFFMIGSIDNFVGEIVFNVDVIDFPDVEVSVNPIGKVSPRTGEVTVSGTVTCSDAATVDLLGDVQQRRGQLTIQQLFGVSVSCAGGEEPTQWSATFTGENGKFVAGRASVRFDASVCVGADCLSIPEEEPTTVQLRGQGKV